MDEHVIYLLKVLEVGLIASVKFAISPFEAERYGFNFRESFLITTAGGIFGVFVFTYMGHAIAFGWRKIKNIFYRRRDKDKPLKKFKWSTRFIIKTKMRFGLIGVALITPSVISIPVGTFLIHRFYRRRGRNILALIVFILFWSTVLNLTAQYIKLSQYIPQ